MAIKITENGVVNYENSPDVNRKLFPNLNICVKEINELADEIDGKAPLIVNTASGSIASFDNGADDMPLKSCVVSIEPIQDLHGYDSPWPVGGGKNKSDVNTINSVGWAIKNNDLLAVFNALVNGTYTISFKVTVKTVTVESVNGWVFGGVAINSAGNVNFQRWIQNAAPTVGEVKAHSVTFTIDDNNRGNFTACYVYGCGNNQQGQLGTVDLSEIQIESGSTATAYAPYSNICPISGRTGLTVYHSGSDMDDPTTYTVNWQTEAGTVYGGYVDVVSGKLVIDRAMVDLGTLTWHWNTVNGWIAPFEGIKPTGNNSIAMNAICSTMPVVSKDDSVRIVADGTNVDTIAATWQGTHLYGSNANASPTGMLCYALATPITYQLTPQEVRTLLGVNNIWSDAGDVSVESPADTKTYIDELSIKTVEVSGQSPTITAEKNTRYSCGEVTSLTFMPCETGICDVRFTAASISTVLTLPETVKLPDWFDPTLLEANTTYEINIVDGIYGVVMLWA